jgi:hypothetical protein
MILKYNNEGIWVYTDNVAEVQTRVFDTAEAILEYNSRTDEDKIKDIEKDSTPEIKAFLIAIEDMDFSVLDSESKNKTFTKNLLADIPLDDAAGHKPACYILAELKDRKDCDYVIYITNQEAYLLNDNGKTIERLS